MSQPFFAEARRSLHAALLTSILRVDSSGVWSNADKGNRASKELARGIAARLGEEAEGARLAGQMSGNKFEEICEEFLKETFLKLEHLRPGGWHVERTSGSLGIARYDQFAHLEALDRLADENEELKAALGGAYLIKPDIVIWREPESDEVINEPRQLVDGEQARLTSLRRINNDLPILHASVSCKWTLRSDRAQNARSEALNLVRNRKGRLPHIVAVTAEPTPSRISSLALGTGDIDCVYHFALTELEETLEKLSKTDAGYEDAANLLRTMVVGKRVRDIADLPLDLVV